MQALATAMPANAAKAAEFDRAGIAPPGQGVSMPDPLAGASTVAEDAASAKLGSGVKCTTQPRTAISSRPRRSMN